MLPISYEDARKQGDVCIIGCDPGPVSSAIVAVALFHNGSRPNLLHAAYPLNTDVGNEVSLIYHFVRQFDNTSFFAYECCGAQGRFVGESVFETAAMGGEIRREFRPLVSGTYKLKPGEWRYALCGKANAKTPEIYEAFSEWFLPTGGGHDGLKGNKAQSGPLAALHEAGKGGNVEHLKDALGVALSLEKIRFRSGKDPETYRMPM